MPKQDFASTAAAAQRVAEHPEHKIAAVANTFPAKLHGLKIIDTNIHDFDKNHTRFIVISKNEICHTAETDDTDNKTGMLITLPEDHLGGLHQVLSVFAWRNMNLSKIESRTLKTRLGNYFFFINVVGGWTHPLYLTSLDELHALGAEVKFLGNYPEYRF